MSRKQNDKEYKRNYYQKHKKEIEEKRRVRIAKNPELHKERVKRYAEGRKAKLQAYRKEYYVLHKEEIDARGREWSRNNKERKHQNYMGYREKFFEMYGYTCACCGESIKEFLTIEHIQGRNKGKKTSAYVDYKEAISAYRPDLYEVLCMNCNHAKGRFGYCPHKNRSGYES